MKRILPLALAMIMLLTGIAIAEVTDPKANPLGVSPIVKEGEQVTITYGLAQNINVSDYYDNDYTRLIEERTGVKIEFMLFPTTDPEAKLDLMVASGEKLPDIIAFGISDNVRRANYGAAGAIIPVEEYYERLGAPVRAYCESIGRDLDGMLNELKSPDGHVYAAAIYKDDNFANQPSLRAWINMTWLEKLDLEVPTTYDELYDVLVAFRDLDPNGNGEKDEIPMMGCDSGWQGKSLAYLQNMFIYYDDSGRGFLPLTETGGALDVSYDKDEYREALKYGNTLVKEGLLSTLTFTQASSQLNTYALSKPSVVGIFTMGSCSRLFWNNIDDHYEAFEVCAGPEGVQYQTRTVGNTQACCAISSACEHPEIAFMLLQYMYNSYIGGDPDSMDLFYSNHWGLRGRDWDYAPEGTTGMFSDFGYDANLLVHNKVWGVMSNTQWATTTCVHCICYAPDIMEAFDGNLENNEYWNAVNYGLNFMHMPDEADLVPVLIYTAEETQKWSDARTALTSYVNEARTLFAIGQMDPYSDADWDRYLNELNNLQYQDILAVDQAAYDRTYGG